MLINKDVWVGKRFILLEAFFTVCCMQLSNVLVIRALTNVHGN